MYLPFHPNLQILTFRTCCSTTQRTSQSRLRWTRSSSSLIVSVPESLVLATVADRPLLAVHKDDISREQLKELLYEEIMSFRPPPIS